MDLADIKAKAIGARSFSAVVGPPESPRTISLLTPTQHEMRMASVRAGVADQSDAAAMLVLERALLVLAVVGWSGVTCGDLAPVLQADARGNDVAAFEPGATELLLDAQPDWGAQLWVLLLQQITSRSDRREAAAKN